MGATGAVIVLNGTSSAGKTTLAAELQRRFAANNDCWLLFGIDDFLGKVPEPWLEYFEAGAHADEGIRFTRTRDHITFSAGPIGVALLLVYRQTIANLARSGLNVLVDEVVLDEGAWNHWKDELGDVDTFWIRVDCPIEVCEERERLRRARLPGLARSQAGIVHRYPIYQFSVDTSSAAPADLAEAVIAAHAARRRS